MDILTFLDDRRRGRSHPAGAIRGFIEGVTKGTVPDYQIAAWLMAECLQPIGFEETVVLTKSIAESGQRIDLTGLPKPWIDKHSTGGVGDKTTLVVLPMLAACGLTAVKMSGRGLGITGGTLDKLSSVAGFRLDLTPEEMVRQAGKIGIALTGQSPLLAPADGVLYSLRDATATVDSIPLIVSSILGKKLAGGAELIMLDVKCGSGAFMSDLAAASALAAALEETGNACGVEVHADVTDMSEPLGAAVGNVLEVQEAWAVLRGEQMTPPTRRFRELCIGFVADCLYRAKLEESISKAKLKAATILDSGSARAKAEEWYRAQGAEGFEPPHQKLEETVIFANEAGYVAKLDAGAVGRAVLDLGGGRHTKSDGVDLEVGFLSRVTVGSRVEKGEELGRLFSRTREAGEAALATIQAGIEIQAHPAPPTNLVMTREGS